MKPPDIIARKKATMSFADKKFLLKFFDHLAKISHRDAVIQLKVPRSTLRALKCYCIGNLMSGPKTSSILWSDMVIETTFI